MVAPACGIFALSNTLSLVTAISGILSLVLLFPFLVYALYRRFLPVRWSLALILLFVAIPIGTLFGTSFVQYEQWASRGFADPAAYILFVAGVLPIIGGRALERRDFWPAFFGALLLALGILTKPIVAPAAAILLGVPAWRRFICGNGHVSQVCASGSFLRFPWRSIIGSMDTCSCSSAPMLNIPPCW